MAVTRPSDSPRLYFDNNTGSRGLVASLRNVGFECLTAAEAGMAAASDEDQLAFAAGAEMTLVTEDISDFSSLHWQRLSSSRVHSGILLVHQERIQIGELLRYFSSLPASEALRNQLIWV